MHQLCRTHERVVFRLGAGGNGCHSHMMLMQICLSHVTHMNESCLNSEQAMPFIIAIWMIQILVLGYWFRAMESTACLFGLPTGSTAEIFFTSPTAEHLGCQVSILAHARVISTHVHAHTRTQHTHTHTHTRTHTHTHTCMYTCIYMFAYMYTRMHVFACI